MMAIEVSVGCVSFDLAGIEVIFKRLNREFRVEGRIQLRAQESCGCL